jgi:hypothetical protein
VVSYPAADGVATRFPEPFLCADFLPENLAPVKDLVRKHPVLATCAVLALGGLLSARVAAALEKA